MDDVLSLSSNRLNSEEPYSSDPTFDKVTNLPDYVLLAEDWFEVQLNCYFFYRRKKQKTVI